MKGARARSCWATLVVLLVASGPLAAQGGAAAGSRAQAAEGSVAGRVVGEGGQGLASAGVVVRRAADGVAVRTGVAGPDGGFRVTGVPAGRYTVEASSLGYEAGRSPVVVASGAAAEVGVIHLAAAPIALKSVQVEARRSSVVLAPDRTVYSTRDMPVAASGMATDVLRHVPELDVDVNGKLSLRGSSNVNVQINGRAAPVRGDQLAQFLQQFPANRIERIEVIPNPSAKFESEGTAGIVNIVLKQGADLGLSGSLALNTGTRVNGSSARLAYQKGRLTFFGGGTLNFTHVQGSSRDLRENLLTTPLTSLSQNGLTDNHNRLGMQDVSAEWKLSKPSVLWLGGTFYEFGANGKAATDYLLMDTLSSDPLQRYDRGGNSHYFGSVADVSLGYRRVVQPQRDELSVSVRGAQYRMNSNAGNTQDLFSGTGTTTPGQMSLDGVHHVISELSVQADLTHPLGKSGKLEAGALLSSRPVDRDETLSLFASPSATTPLQVQDGTWRHRAQVNALYGTLTRKLGRMTAQAGLRGEDATSSFRVPATGERFDYSYRNLFPSAALAYDLKGGRELRLAYSKRIDRPYPMMMNPYVPSADPLNRQVGNPYLQPKYTHSLTMDLSWTMTQGSLRLSPYYRKTYDNWDQVKEADTAGVGWVTWQNLAQVRAYGTTATASLRQLRPLSGFLSVGGYREIRDASNLSTGFSGSSIRFSANTNANLRVNADLDAQLAVNYQPPRDIPQGHISHMLMSSFGFKQKLPRQATLTAAVIDPFNLWHYEFVTRDRTHVQTSWNAYSQRRVNLSLSYAFGKMPQPKAKRDPAADPQAAAGGGGGPIH